jgi:hypothetical protein
MIREGKQEAVKKALQSSFGTTDFEEIIQLTKGLSSALVYRVVVLGKPYLLRVVTRTDAMADPTLCYSAMKAGVLKNTISEIFMSACGTVASACRI